VRLSACPAERGAPGGGGGAPLATLVLIHGAAGSPWDWHLLVPELQQRGDRVAAVDLPCEDDSAGLPEYADTVVDAIEERGDLVIVAHPFGGFTATLVCERGPVRLLVMLNAMVPALGESPGDGARTPGTRRRSAGRRRQTGVSGDGG
jgi:pimeloyl-ACP methyl ester carboxylesterase